MRCSWEGLDPFKISYNKLLPCYVFFCLIFFLLVSFRLNTYCLKYAFYCYSGECRAKRKCRHPGDCPWDQYCDRYFQACRKGERRCSYGHECNYGQICKGGVCQKRECTKHKDCNQACRYPIGHQNDQDILVSYDVSSLFTVNETIELLAEKAFRDDWFNKEHNLNITKPDLTELLGIATKNQLFQFQGNLYEQVDGVAMGSPLGPLMANTFMCGIEEQLEIQNKMPAFYKRYVDDTLSKMPDATAASEYLSTLNEIHPSVSFTMELEDNNRLPFLGMEIIKNGSQLDTKVYKKPTDTGLLLHYQSHVDVKYNHSLLKTMLNRAFKLSSNWKLFHQECPRLKETFARLQYPEFLVETTIRQFVEAKVVTGNACPQQQQAPSQQEVPIRVVLPYKDQKAANSVRRQLSDLSRKINTEIRPVYTSRKIKDTIKVKEQKPPIVNQQSAVYYFKCDLCNADYVCYSCRHLHQRIEEHKGSAIGRHIKEQHGKKPDNIEKNFIF